MAPPPALTVLALNSGSSSLKFGLYRVQVGSQPPQLFWGGTEEVNADLQPVWEKLVAQLQDRQLPKVQAIGHRLVHGGPQVRSHRLINEQVEQQLEAARPFAPLHLPAALNLIAHTRRQYPGIPQIACLDTAFHAGLPEVARTLPLPRVLREAGIERYGFHGLSCESILQQLGDELPPRTLIAHLGNGASLTAVAAGRSVDTTMGLTPSGGLVMSSRCGDLDPGVLVHLLRTQSLDAAQLETLINSRSGMLGISGLSGDMRKLRAAVTGDENARLAVAMFVQSVRKQIGAMAAVLGGLDLLVFTGGIGEHDVDTRREICAGLDWLGPFAVRVLPAQEELQIARHCRTLLAGTIGSD